MKNTLINYDKYLNIIELGAGLRTQYLLINTLLKPLRLVVIFLMLRFFDMYSTYLVLQRFGVQSEDNGINRYMFKQYGISQGIIANLLVSSALAFFLYLYATKYTQRMAIYMLFACTLFAIVVNFHWLI